MLVAFIALGNGDAVVWQASESVNGDAERESGGERMEFLFLLFRSQSGL